MLFPHQIAFANYSVNARDVDIPIIAPKPINKISQVPKLIKSLLHRKKAGSLDCTGRSFLPGFQMESSNLQQYLFLVYLFARGITVPDPVYRMGLS